MKKIIKILGMHCASCAINIEKALKSTKGITEANVNFASEKANITYDQEIITLEEIKKIISDLGYEAVESEGTGIELKIFGMHSTHCSSLIENTLKKTKGILEAKVEFANEKALIRYDPAVITKNKIKKIITDLGYRVEERLTVDREREAREKEIKDLRKRFIFSLIFGLPLLYFSMGWMVGLPVPLIENASTQALIQLILTTPVIIAAFNLYTSGAKALLKKAPSMDSLIFIGTSAAYLYSMQFLWQYGLVLASMV
jgi:Cu+-exporting ATPase